MNHALDGSRLKVERAREHLGVLTCELGKYLASTPYKFVVSTESGTVTATLKITIAPPLYLSAIVGDCVSNLSAALDYIAWQLAIRYWNKKPVAGKDKLYFFWPNGLNKNGMDLSVLDFTKKFQPEQNKYLRILKEIVNEDKHRLPLLTLAHVYGREISLSVRAGDVVTEGIASSAHSVSIYVGEGVDDIKVKGDAHVFVTPQNQNLGYAPIEQTLDTIVKSVSDVVQKFEQFLS